MDCGEAVDNPIRMPFGKHKGKVLADVPKSYLEWFCRQPEVFTDLGDAMEDELDRRVRDSYEPPEEVDFCAEDRRAFFR